MMSGRGRIGRRGLANGGSGMKDGQWLGVHLKSDGAVSAAAAISLAREAEAHGFHGVTLNEDVGHDAFALLGAMAGATSQIAIGSAIANVYCRSALQLAMAAATVDELSNGRCVLGLSVGHHPWNDRYHGIAIEPPLPRLREYLNFIRVALTGKEFTFDGRIFSGVRGRLGVPLLREDLPIFVGGDRAGMLALSAELADGSIMNVVPASYVANFAAEHYFATARSFGRSSDDLDLVAIVTCVVDENRERAIASARRTFVGRLRSNPAKVMALRPGVHSEELQLRVAQLAEGEFDRVVEEISEEIVTDTIAAGTKEEVQAHLDRFYLAGCTRVLVAPFPRTPETIMATIHALAPTIPSTAASAAGVTL